MGLGKQQVLKRLWKAGGQIGQVSRTGEWNIQVLGEIAFDCNGQDVRCWERGEGPSSREEYAG